MICARGLAGKPGWVGHHRYAIVWEKRLGAGVGVGARQSAFAVAEYELVLGSCARVRFRGGFTCDPELGVLRPAFEQVTAVRAGGTKHRKGEVHELRDYAVAAVSVLVRELMGALRGVEVGADDQQTLGEVLVRQKLKEACAVVAAAPGSFAVLLVALVCDHVGEVHEVAQVVLEGDDEAVVRIVGQ